MPPLLLFPPFQCSGHTGPSTGQAYAVKEKEESDNWSEYYLYLENLHVLKGICHYHHLKVCFAALGYVVHEALVDDLKVTRLATLHQGTGSDRMQGDREVKPTLKVSVSLVWMACPMGP
jgi:hypothetical protein